MIQCQSSDSVARVPCRANVDPPSAERPKAIATASTTVDFPDPFSPTRIVTPDGRSSPESSIWATAGIVVGHW